MDLINYLRGRQRPAPEAGEQVLRLALAHAPEAFAAPDLLQVRQFTSYREAADAVLVRRLPGAGAAHGGADAAGGDPRRRTTDGLAAPAGAGPAAPSRASNVAAFAALARREAAAAMPVPAPGAYRPVRTSAGRLANALEKLRFHFGSTSGVSGHHDWTHVALSADSASIAARHGEAVCVWNARNPSSPAASVGTNVLATGTPLLDFSGDGRYVMWTEAGDAHLMSLRDEERGTDSHRVWAVNQQAPIEAMAWRPGVAPLRVFGGQEFSRWPSGATTLGQAPLPRRAASRSDLAAVASGLRERAAWLGVETIGWTGGAQPFDIVAACADVVGNALYDVVAGEGGSRLSGAALDTPLARRWSLWLEVTGVVAVRWLPLPRHLAVVGASESVVLALTRDGGMPPRGWMLNGRWLDASANGRVLTVRTSAGVPDVSFLSPCHGSDEDPYRVIYQIHQLAVGRSITLDFRPPMAASPRLGRLAADGTRALLAHGRHACVVNLWCAASPPTLRCGRAVRWLESWFPHDPPPYTTRPLAADELQVCLA